jgi:hypothetical protein
MSLQVHCIVEQPQNFGVALTLVGSNAEQHEVPALVTVSCYVERRQPSSDLTPFFRTNRRWSGG